MSCTTILVGKNASYDGSTIIARDDDSGSGRYDPKRFVAVAPDDQPRHYRSVLSHVEIELPDNPCRYTIAPNVLNNRGILAEAGANEHNVAMSATETIAVNERVLGADPMVELRPAVGEPDSTDYQAEQPGGKRKIALPAAGQLDLQRQRRDGRGQGEADAQDQAARAAALRLPALELLLRAAGEGGGAHAQQRQRPAQQRRRAQQKSARAADGQRGKEHQRAEEQRVKPARGHLSLTGMRTAESTSANACSFV